MQLSFDEKGNFMSHKSFAMFILPPQQKKNSVESQKFAAAKKTIRLFW